MGLFGFSKTLLLQATDSKDLVARYKRLRPIRLRLNNELVSRLPRDVLDEGAKRIGMLRDGMFIFNNEDETCVLMDYCIYDVYRRGRNAVDQYLVDCPPDADSDEMAVLHAMQHATYTLVAALRVEPHVGCHVTNLFTEETRLLIDMGFSRTAQPGAVMATRLLDFGGYVATGGAALPLGILDHDGLDEWQRNLRAGVDDDRLDPAPLIRACIQRDASSHIRYEGTSTKRLDDVGKSFLPTRTSAERIRERKKLRVHKAVTKRRCRCGSGKLFKNCCGKR